MANEPTARERAEKLLVDMAFMSTMECHLDMIVEALTAAEQRGREAALAPRLALLESALAVCASASVLMKLRDKQLAMSDDYTDLREALAAHHALLDTGR